MQTNHFQAAGLSRRSNICAQSQTQQCKLSDSAAWVQHSSQYSIQLLAMTSASCYQLPVRHLKSAEPHVRTKFREREKKKHGTMLRL